MTHDFANQLFLAPQGPICARRFCQADLVDEVLIGINAVELLVGQSHQLFAEILQLKILSFFCALTGLCVYHGLSYHRRRIGDVSTDGSHSADSNTQQQKEMSQVEMSRIQMSPHEMSQVEMSLIQMSTQETNL